jgi:hypothetical protein
MLGLEFEEAMEAKECAIMQFQDVITTYQYQLTQVKSRHEKELENTNIEKVK